MRIVFMGTPDFSVPPLEKIIDSNHEVIAVYSQPPRRAGRGMAERMSPVHTCAAQHDIPVFTPKSLKNTAEQQSFAAHNADAAVVVAYGLILPKPILNAPRFGCFNLHASNLPRWRGAAPIQRAIMAGDTQTAAMIMHMDEGLDTGPVCMAEHVDIEPDMTAGELHDELSQKGADLVVATLDALDAGTLTETPQPESGITYATKIEKSEARLDFSKDAGEVHNHIRGLSPFPGAWFEAPLNDKFERIKVVRSRRTGGAGQPGEVLSNDGALTIACANGAVELVELQRSGKRPASATEFLRGFPIEPGTVVR